jgi:CrcB protein
VALPDEPVDPDQPASGRPGADVLLAVALGGAIGATARYEAGLRWPVHAGDFPTTTFLVNTTGAFAIGFVLTVLLARWPAHRYARPFLCVGLLGGWTTMSTLAVEADLLVRDGHAATATAYVVTTTIAGLLATVAGMVAGRRLKATA